MIALGALAQRRRPLFSLSSAHAAIAAILSDGRQTLASV